jgi:hypothetical protein
MCGTRRRAGRGVTGPVEDRLQADPQIRPNPEPPDLQTVLAALTASPEEAASSPR